MTGTAWPEVRLGDVCTFQYGKALPKAKRSDTGFGVYGSNGSVGFHEKAFTSGPTIVVGRKGSFGEVAFSPEPCWPIDTTYFIDSDSTKADLRWLYHRLRDLPLKRLNRAAAVPGLNREDAYAQRLLLPPIEEQRRIAAVLDAADALRAKRRQALAKLDTLTQAIFIDMFGDALRESRFPIYPLAEVSLKKGEYGANVASVERSHDRPRYLRITDIRSDGTLNDDAVSPAGDPSQWSKKVLGPGDITFARSGATVGKSYLTRDEDGPMVFAGYLIRFTPHEELVLPDFLFQFAQTPMYWAWVRSETTTVAQPNLNAKKYGSMPVPLPSIDLQRKFVSTIYEVRHRRHPMADQGRELDNLFRSLQQRAFRGDL